MIVKNWQEFHRDRNDESLVLPMEAVCAEDPGVYYKWYTRFHEESGWEISGKLNADMEEWVQPFKATHPVHGVVEGDFDDEVRATSEAALEHFLIHHPLMGYYPADV